MSEFILNRTTLFDFFNSTTCFPSAKDDMNINEIPAVIENEIKKEFNTFLKNYNSLIPLEVEDYSEQYYNFNASRNDGNVSIRY